jgi:glycosyltransferase involved in cell wall biosynthesis
MLIEKKILVTVPHLSLPGGVTGLFNLLELNKNEKISYFSVNFNSKNWSVLLLPVVYLKFIFFVRKVDVVHINPSLDAKSFYRDLVFSFISKIIFKKKTIIYWHGWQDFFFNKIKKSTLKTKLFQLTFGKADCQIVLANKFSKDLKSIGYKGRIYLESNVTEKIEFTEKLEKNEEEKFQLIYISRITKGKGWEIAIKTVEILNELGKYNIHLTFAGDGDCLEEAKNMVKEKKISNISFTGHISGDKKNNLLKQSDILFFPTCYPEGMPITILEGMMYGMPIISRNEGGIPDHIKNEINGFLTESRDPLVFSDFIIKLITNKKLFNEIRKNNLVTANIKFIPERLLKRLLELYN